MKSLDDFKLFLGMAESAISKLPMPYYRVVSDIQAMIKENRLPEDCLGKATEWNNIGTLLDQIQKLYLFVDDVECLIKHSLE